MFNVTIQGTTQEGGELYALKGARETIKNYRPALVIDYSEPTCKDAGYSKSDLLAELTGNNYAIFGIPANNEATLGAEGCPLT